ncbi:RNase H-like domain found in reverse transcriptase [Popillia japonica]|uniref:RNase H-like domain found in reverse transcriptase n=1 Tax=Popillia japonica TaxID=7064 RepID=A0AAW1JDB8_POPJA
MDIDNHKYTTVVHIVPEQAMEMKFLLGTELLNQAQVTITAKELKLNKITAKVNKDIEETLLKDDENVLKNGFFHVPMDEESRKYTSFVTPTAQYEFLKTPFGLCLSPAVFQRFINDVFRSHIQKGEVFTYLDDLIIVAKNEEEGLTRLRNVLKTAEEYGLLIQWKKCQFLQDNVDYLGHRVKYNMIQPSADKTKAKFLQDNVDYLGHRVKYNMIQPSADKTKAVGKFPKPTNTKQVQSFLGLTGYFRRFIADYALIAKPLSDLLKKDAKFVFGEAQQLAFNQLKELLTNGPVLAIYDPEKETELHTDASKFGYGAILLQKGDDMTLKKRRSYIQMRANLGTVPYYFKREMIINSTQCIT